MIFFFMSVARDLHNYSRTSFYKELLSCYLLMRRGSAVHPPLNAVVGYNSNSVIVAYCTNW